MPADAVLNMRDLLISSVSSHTISTYSTGLGAFLAFCEERQIIDVFPVSESTLGLFLAFAIGRFSHSYARQWFQGVRFYHSVWGMPFPHSENSPLIRGVLNAVRTNLPPSSSKNIRHPLSDEMLLCIHSHLDLSLAEDAAVWAATCLAVLAMLRSVDFTVSSLARFDPSANPSKSDVRLEGDHFTLWLPKEKTHRSGIKVLIPSKHQSFLNPHIALSNHFLINHSRDPSNSPLFAFFSNDRWRTLSKPLLTRRIESILTPHFPDFKFFLHSFRISGMLHWLLRGSSFEDVKIQGRWADVGSWRLYLRDHSAIMALHLGQVESRFSLSSDEEERALEAAIRSSSSLVV